ncbi:MAG: ATP synthase subunit I [candidate division NC10 bacterium]|nr:ATP synthase subunit I [candidate division NC10 bacterium]
MKESQVFVKRTYRLALILTGLGVGLSLVLGRGDWALGFGVGAGISLANFALIARATTRVFYSGRGGRIRYPWKGFLFRFLVVGILLFLAIFFLKINFFALVLGLLAAQISMCGGLLFWGQALRY